MNNNAPDEHQDAPADLQQCAALFDALAQPVVAWGLDGRISRANRAAAQLFGWPAGAMSGLRIDHLLPPLHPVGEDVSSITEIAQRGESWAGDARFVRRGGETFVAAISQRPLHGADGELLGTVVIITDTSEQRQAENALRMRDQQLRMLMAHAPVVIWTTDSAGIITYFEGGALQGIGLSSGDFVGTSAFAQSDLAPHVSEHHRRALAGETFAVSVAVGGRTFDTHYSPLRQPRGAIIGAMAVAIDVTPRSNLGAGAASHAIVHLDVAGERRNAGLERQLSAAIDESTSRGRQLASAAHELRSPLAVIRGYLSTITEYRERLSAAEVVDLVTRSQVAVAQIERLVNDLLALAKVDAGELRTSARQAPLREILDQAVEQLRIAHPQRDIAFRFDAGDARIRGDAGLFRDVIAHLLDNAVKYSPEATPIDLDVPAPGDGMVSVTVRDRGPGVPAVELDRIFGRFHRVRTAANATVAGAGLGLAVCRAIVERHKGRIEAAAAPGGGLAVTFTLPLAARKPKRR